MHSSVTLANTTTHVYKSETTGGRPNHGIVCLLTQFLAAAKQWANIPLTASLLFSCGVIPARIAGGLVYEPPGATVGLDLYDTEKDGRIESAG